MKKLLYILTILLSLNSYSQITLIPDAIFEQRLIDYGLDTGSPDGSVPTMNIDTVTYLNLNSGNISSLIGIQDFTALNWLECGSNQLTSLDLSQNVELFFLYCEFNFISSINVTQSSALAFLYCYNNQLTSLNLTQNLQLTFLECGNNLLSSLDLSQNTALDYLTCDNNQITSLDLSNNTLLTTLICNMNQLTCLNTNTGQASLISNFEALSNPNLFCVEVNSPPSANAFWQAIDPQTTFSAYCGNACSVGVNELDLNFTKKLSKIVDLTGREVQYSKNIMMIYVFDDGSNTRVFEFE